MVHLPLIIDDLLGSARLKEREEILRASGVVDGGLHRDDPSLLVGGEESMSVRQLMWRAEKVQSYLIFYPPHSVIDNPPPIMKIANLGPGQHDVSLDEKLQESWRVGETLREGLEKPVANADTFGEVFFDGLRGGAEDAQQSNDAHGSGLEVSLIFW